jgi:hypothetical protein
VSALGEAPVELLKVIPTVRDAIDAGCPIMKTIRVFVSSTGDVQKERHLADRVMRSIAAEFDLPVSATYSTCQTLGRRRSWAAIENHRPLVLCPYFLEYQRFQPDAGYQGQIPNTAEFAQRRETAFLLKAEEADGCLRAGEKSFPTPTKIDVPWLRRVNKVQTSQHWK